MTTLRLDSSCFTAFSAAYHRWLLPFVWVSARVHVYVCVYVYVCVCACVFLWSCKLEAKSEQYCGLHWTRSIRQKILITCYLLHNFEKQKKGGGSKKAEKGEERRKRKKKKNEGLKRWTSGGIAECVCCRCPTTVLLFVLFACPAALQIVRVFFFFLTFIDVCRQVCKASVRRRICKTIAWLCRQAALA